MIGDNMGTAHLKNVYFQRSNGEFILLMDGIPETDVHLVIRAFLDKHNFKSYYTRTWEKDGVRWYDVGSHTQFFIWASEEDYNKLIADRENHNDCN